MNMPDHPDKQRLQDEEYAIPYHYRDLFAPGQEIERKSLFDLALEKLALNKDAWVLDVGCGDGRFCYHAKEYVNISGIDISERALNWARTFSPEIEFQASPVQEMERSDFDGMVCLEVIEHIPDDLLPPTLAGMVARLKPGGTAFFSVPSINQPLYEKHYRHYDEELLRNTLEPHFTILEILGHSRTKSMARPFFSILNLISCLFFSETVCSRFKGIVRMTIAAKKKLWYKYLHIGPPRHCNRLVAVCSKKQVPS